jgi:hypothetical protein
VLAHRTLRSGPIPATISRSTDDASAKQPRYRRQKSRQLRQISGPSLGLPSPSPPDSHFIELISEMPEDPFRLPSECAATLKATSACGPARGGAQDRSPSEVIWPDRLAGRGIIALRRSNSAHLHQPWRASGTTEAQEMRDADVLGAPIAVIGMAVTVAASPPD